jgi:hypothetical protein
MVVSQNFSINMVSETVPDLVVSSISDILTEALIFLQGLPTSEVVPKKKKNSVALVRKRTIPTERPPLSAK